MLATPCGPTVKADKGCNLSPRCVSCHLPKCKDEYLNGLVTIQAERTREMVAGLYQLEWPVYTIADRLGVCERTVIRLSEES